VGPKYAFVVFVSAKGESQVYEATGTLVINVKEQSANLRKGEFFRNEDSIGNK